MRSRRITIGIGLIALVGMALLAAVPPDGMPFSSFDVTVLADGLNQPKGLDFATHQAGAGAMGRNVFVAESGVNRILEVATDGSGYEVHATNVGLFPVGMACYGGPFGRYMFVGVAFSGGIYRCGDDGVAAPYALAGMDVAGLDFGKGDFGGLLYAGEWTTGNIWRLYPDGSTELFTTIPNIQTRYISFSDGGAFGHYLYVTNYLAGEIYRVAPDGTYELFADIGSPALEGLAFSRGGAFGKYLYAGDLSLGEIYRVDADGSFEVWATGFDGAADIRFMPGGPGGFTMYMVDGVSKVYQINRKGKGFK